MIEGKYNWENVSITLCGREVESNPIEINITHKERRKLLK
jgi:hypothetical protein